MATMEKMLASRTRRLAFNVRFYVGMALPSSWHA